MKHSRTKFQIIFYTKSVRIRDKFHKLVSHMQYFYAALFSLKWITHFMWCNVLTTKKIHKTKKGRQKGRKNNIMKLSCTKIPSFSRFFYNLQVNFSTRQNLTLTDKRLINFTQPINTLQTIYGTCQNLHFDLVPETVKQHFCPLHRYLSTAEQTSFQRKYKTI